MTAQGPRPPLGHVEPRLVLGFLRLHLWNSLAVLGLLLVMVGYSLIMPLAYKRIFDDVIGRRDGGLLRFTALAVAAAYLLLAVACVLHDRLATRLGTCLLNDLRLRMFEQVQRLPAGWFAGRSSAEVISRFASDLSVVETAMVRPLASIVMFVTKAALCSLLLFFVEWRLALLTCLAMPLALLAPKLFGERAMASARANKSEEGGVMDVVHESVGAHAIVRAFGLQSSRLELFSARLRRLARTSDDASFWAELVGRGAYLGVELLQILVILAGALLVVRGHLSVGSLVGFVALLVTVGGAASSLSQLLPPLVQAMASAGRIADLLSQPAMSDADDSVDLPRLSREIRFDRVSLREPRGAPIEEVSLTIGAGTSVAVVGASGSGKSTLLGLLLRFADPTEGRILFDGIDLRRGREASLRVQTAAVLQDSILFDASVRENIRAGRLAASDAEVEAAAARSDVHDAILRLPLGYDSPAGERGGLLSGGERQRIAIARALLRDPAILVLDEVTSALDPIAAAAVNATLGRLESGRTVIRVTHRLEEIAHFSHVFVLDGGRLVEQGAPGELRAQAGRYARMWDKQSGFRLGKNGAEIDPARLRAIPLFDGLDAAMLAEMATWMGSESLPSDRFVFAEGDAGDRLFFIVRGSVEVLRMRDGEQRLDGVLSDGDYFGELALLDDDVRNATVRTRSACVFLTLSHHGLRRLLAAAPSVRSHVERVAALRRNDRANGEADATAQVPRVNPP